jgi:hypothetical protein
MANKSEIQLRCKKSKLENLLMKQNWLKIEIENVMPNLSKKFRDFLNYLKY